MNFKITKQLIPCLLLLIFASCNKDISIDQPMYTPKIVVDGWIESGEFAHVLLTLSSPFLMQYDSASIRATFLNYAKITVSNSKNESEILTLFKDVNYFPPFVYRSISLKGEIGESYNLKIETMGHILTASTTIPAAPSLNEISLIEKSDTAGIIQAIIQGNSTQSTHLFVQTKSLKADNNFHPASPSVFTLQPSTSNYITDIYRIRETNFYLKDPKKTFYFNWPNWQFAKIDTVLIKIGTVDEQSFKILQSIFYDKSNRENPFTFNGAGISTNINGGIGRWTGIGIAPIRVVMPSTP